VAEVSKTTVATLMLLASSPSRLTGMRVERRGAVAAVTWEAAVESGIREYIVAWGPEGEAPRQTVRVQQPQASLQGVLDTDVIRVKAVSGSGAESWDWAVGATR
jgi:hypothetical protein